MDSGMGWVGRWEDRRTGGREDGKVGRMGRWEDGKMGRWGNQKMERQQDEKMGRIRGGGGGGLILGLLRKDGWMDGSVEVNSIVLLSKSTWQQTSRCGGDNRGA